MSSLNDLVGGAHFINKENASFVQDRWVRQNSAIHLKNGYLQAPEGVYFYDEFTITVWMKLIETVEIGERIIDFALDNERDNFGMYMFTNSGIMAFVRVNKDRKYVYASGIINVNQWYHIAFSLKANGLLLYVDGYLISTNVYDNSFKARANISIGMNYIGKGSGNKNINGVLSHLKIYNTAISAARICENVNMDGLIHYRPMSSLNDLVGGAHLYDGANYSFVEDRLHNSNSAIYFKRGYLRAPNGVYFSGGDFTITDWVRIKSKSNWERIIDFGNGVNHDNVGLYVVNKYIVGFLRDGAEALGKISYVEGNYDIILDKWYHIAFILNQKFGSIYVNGERIAKRKVDFAPSNVTRNMSYIGKCKETLNANAVYSHLRIYNISITTGEKLCGFDE